LRRIIIKWDRETLEHIARHGIRREEVEDVFRGRVYVRKRGDEYHIIGRSQDKIIFLPELQNYGTRPGPECMIPK
jgi:hypothetical protein